MYIDINYFMYNICYLVLLLFFVDMLNIIVLDFEELCDFIGKEL